MGWHPCGCWGCRGRPLLEVLEACGEVTVLRCESVAINRRRGGEVLEASFRQPHLPALT
jgi:hypothetical protein